jgi:heterodisulfide reductase subunit A-like polyferredoxin
MKAAIQVVFCKCCTEVPPLLSIERLLKQATDTNMVVSVMTADAVCDGKDVRRVVADAKDKEADRAVVFACSRKNFDPALLDAYRRAGVNEFLVDIVNLREEAVLSHLAQPEAAQAKAETMLRVAIEKIVAKSPLQKQTEEMKTRNVVIIGAGVAGRAAAEEAAKAGVHTVLLEKSGRSYKAPGVILTNSQLLAASGYGGNFRLRIKAGEKLEELDAAAVIIATGGGWTTLKGSLAKAVKDAVPLYKFHEQMQSGAAPNGPVVFVDTPDPAGKTLNVRDFAWDETLETALELKKKHHAMDIYVVFQEMRAMGLTELAYKEAAELGIRFVRYDRAGMPKVDQKNPGVVAVKDASQDQILNIRFGTMVFASNPLNEDNKAIADALRIPMSADGGIRRGSIQRGPVSTPSPGIFVCGSALFPKTRDVAKEEGEAAGALAGEFVRKGRIEYGGVVAQVTQERCSACLTCVRTCPYEAPFIGTASKAEIRVQACQGCGMCVGICPSKAIELVNFTDDIIGSEARTLLGGDF